MFCSQYLRCINIVCLAEHLNLKLTKKLEKLDKCKYRKHQPSSYTLPTFFITILLCMWKSNTPFWKQLLIFDDCFLYHENLG